MSPMYSLMGIMSLFLIICLEVKNTKTSPAVIVTQSPCINQTRKNLCEFSLIFLNLLSPLHFNILYNKNPPNLIVQNITIPAANICLLSKFSEFQTQNNVATINAKLPVMSKNT